MDVVDVTPIGPQPLKDTAVRSACDKTLKPEVRSLPNCSKLGKPESHNDLPLRLPRSLRLERDVLFIGTRFSNLYTAVHECVTVIMMALVRHGDNYEQTGPHRPRLVVSRGTCPPLSPCPHANSFIIGTAVINTHTSTVSIPK